MIARRIHNFFACSELSNSVELLESMSVASIYVASLTFQLWFAICASMPQMGGL